LIDDVIKYFQENGYQEETARKAFKYYATADWKDSKGSQVRSWKQKMIAVWFKDENKTQPSQSSSRTSGITKIPELTPFPDDAELQDVLTSAREMRRKNQGLSEVLKTMAK
jgi:hypothetical protein